MHLAYYLMSSMHCVVRPQRASAILTFIGFALGKYFIQCLV